MDNPNVDEIIRANVARTRLREMICAISKRIYSKYRTSRRAKMEEVLTVMREFGSYINTFDSYGDTSMHVACRLEKCDMDILQELLKNGGQVDTLDGGGDSSLHLVAKNPRGLDMMRELLKYCANPNITNMQGETPLLLAIKHSRPDLTMVYELLEHGADFRIADNKGRNSLHAAVKNPNCTVDLIKKFLHEAPSLVNCQDNFTNNSPLHGAVRYCNNLEIVKELLDCGADPNLKNKRGRTPLHIAVLKPHADIVELLLKHGADVNVLDSSHLSPLHHALSVDKPDISIIKSLVKYGANVNAVNQYDMNVLYVAVCNPTTPCEIIKFMLENGAKPDFDERNNILGNIDEPSRHHIADIVIPYISVKKVEEAIASGFGNLDFFSLVGYVMDRFKEILSGSASEQLSVSYKYCTDIASTCVMELLTMRNDVIAEGQTLFQFVSENCSRITPLDQQAAVRVIDEVLLRLKAEKYVQCKDLIYSSIKCSTLIDRLCELKICCQVKPAVSTVLTLHSLCINNIAEHLSKEDVINMIIAFSDKFRPPENPSSPSSSKRNIEEDDEEEDHSKRLRE